MSAGTRVFKVPTRKLCAPAVHQAISGTWRKRPTAARRLVRLVRHVSFIFCKMKAEICDGLYFSPWASTQASPLSALMILVR